jgi:hypothetical protein
VFELAPGGTPDPEAIARDRRRLAMFVKAAGRLEGHCRQLLRRKLEGANFEASLANGLQHREPATPSRPQWCADSFGNRGANGPGLRVVYLQTEQRPPFFEQCLQYLQFEQARHDPSRSGVHVAAWTQPSPATAMPNAATIIIRSIRPFIASSALECQQAPIAPTSTRALPCTTQKARGRRHTRSRRIQGPSR